MKSRSSMIVGAAFAGICGATSAQEYPVKPVRIVAPFAAGGATDVLTRVASVKLTERWGQSVIVDNRVGARSCLRRTVTRCSWRVRPTRSA